MIQILFQALATLRSLHGSICISCVFPLICFGPASNLPPGLRFQSESNSLPLSPPTYFPAAAPKFLRALCGSPQIIKVWISRYLLAMMARVACSSVTQAGWDISMCLMCWAVKVGQTHFVSHDIWKISFHGKSFRHSRDARTMGIITQGVNPRVPLCSPHRCCSLGLCVCVCVCVCVREAW